jgi:hypothetical protein
MAYRATLNRKTRHQKIQASQRQSAGGADPIKVVSQDSGNSSVSAPAASFQYAYVLQDLKKIAWITVICLALLLLATVFISDIQPFVQLRHALNLPTL